MRPFLSKAIALGGVVVSLVLAPVALAGSTLIKSERIVTNTGKPVTDKNILVGEDGRLHFIAKSDTPADTETLEGGSYWVTPGLFAPYATLGLVEVSGEHTTNNINSSNKQASVHIRAADSFNPKSTTIAVTRLGGITHAAVFPGNGETLFGGIGAVVNTTGGFDSVEKPDAFVYINLSGRSNVTGETKGAALAFLRDALEDAAHYERRFKSPSDGNALRRADAKALRPVVAGRMKLFIDADQAIDIVNVLALRKDWPLLDMVIVGGAEAWMVADRLAAARVPVILDPMEDLPYSFDQIASRLDNAARLHKAGVEIAIMSRSGTGGGAHNLRLLPQHAGNAVTNGLDWDTAFAAITSVPASLFGQNGLGVLQDGEKANLVVWDGDPLEVTSAPVAIYIDGKRQSLVSRQTILRDRYHPKHKREKPYGYQP